MTSGSKLRGADIRAKLNHPVVDADGHMIETTFAAIDFVKQAAGADIANKFENFLTGIDNGPARRAVWIGNSGPASIDRATALLPKLFYERLDDAGIDFAVVYGTLALNILRMGDDEMRAAVFRGVNNMYADMFSGLTDRLTPAALIPMHSPDEAVAELEHVVNDLGLKAVVVNAMIWRPAPEAAGLDPEIQALTAVPETPGIDQGDKYDKVWAKCVELGVAPTCHNGHRGRGSTHGSPSNYVFNSLGSFAAGSEYFCRALFMGGVPKRFPSLRFAFLEGGVAWAAQLYNSLFEYWEKRNLDALRTNLDPDKLDVDLLVEMFEKYGNEYLTPERIRAEPDQPISSRLNAPPEDVYDFAEIGLTGPQDIKTIFDRNFYFGCEADDSLNAVAFDTRINHLGARMNAILGSDIGHWDVPDMTKVMVEAYEMVDDGHMDEQDFEDFTFGNVVRMHTGMNPDFFKGTVVEDAVDKLMGDDAGGAAA